MTESAITAVAMKRYEITCHDSDPYVDESKTGKWMRASDIEARDQQIIELLAKLPHDKNCASKRCYKCGYVRHQPWLGDENQAFDHWYKPAECNCPHADIMALLGRR